jgi:flagellar basal-body rod protein FlgB
MIQNSPLLGVFRAMAEHAAEVQKVSAENVARASEPGYKAKAVESFDAYLSRAGSGPGHPDNSSGFRVFEAALPEAPNGNTVNVEREALTAAQAAGQHSMALSVYGKTLDLLRISIGRGR